MSDILLNNGLWCACFGMQADVGVSQAVKAGERYGSTVYLCSRFNVACMQVLLDHFCER